MRMQRRQFRIGELAKELDIKRFVIRFWEKEFGIKTSRSQGGQRFYSEADLEQFKLIKQLLYTQKYTIDGARKHIQNFGKNSTKIEKKPIVSIISSEKITRLHKKLMKLRELL